MKTNLLFSMSLMVCSLATLSGGAIFLESNKGNIRAEPTPTLLPHPAPVDAAPPTIDDIPMPNVINATPITIIAPRPTRTTLAVKVEVPKEMVCSNVWRDSNYGGQYRECEMK